MFHELTNAGYLAKIDKRHYYDLLVTWRTNTVQYRPSEMKIVFGLKVPSIDGLGLIL